MPTNCIYRSVNLQAGESFTLPPGAEIVSATDINAITSTCPIPDNLESLECYVFVVMATHNFTDGATRVWMGANNSGDSNAFIVTITVGGVTYDLSPDIYADSNGVFDVGQLAAAISSNPSINGMMLSLGVAADYDGPPLGGAWRGGVASLCFKTTASIAAETYITLTSTLFGLGSPEPVTTVRAYAQKLSDYSGEGGAGICTCAATT